MFSFASTLSFLWIHSLKFFSTQKAVRGCRGGVGAGAGAGSEGHRVCLSPGPFSTCKGPTSHRWKVHLYLPLGWLTSFVIKLDSSCQTHCKPNAETPRSAAKRGFICKAVKPEDRKNRSQNSFPRQVVPGIHRIMNNAAWQLEAWGAWRAWGKVQWLVGNFRSVQV